MTSRIEAFVRALICTFGMIVLVAHGALAQSALRGPLDSGVIAGVNRFYPGVTEILETREPLGLRKVARSLVGNPSRESLQVLLWMLQYCPSWVDGNGEVNIQLTTLAHSVATLPLTPVANALLRGNADQRLAAAGLLNDGWELMSREERPQLERTLIAALADQNLRVREMVAAPLRRLGTRDAVAALARALNGDDVTDVFYEQATWRARPQSPPEANASTFSAATVAAVNVVAPGFIGALNSRDQSVLTQMRLRLERSSEPETTSVLVWIFVNRPGSESYLPQVLGAPDRATRLPLRELATALITARPELRAGIANLLQRVIARDVVPVRSVDEVIRVLMPHRTDARVDVRFNVLMTLAVAIRGRGASVTGASEIARDLGDLVRGGNLSSFDCVNALYALREIGDRATLPLFEQMARSVDVALQVREAAAGAYVVVSSAADSAAERTRLLWEQPDTVLEQRVRTAGRAALPIVWQALANGSPSERRAASALLGWYRDAASIRPILAALDGSPGAATREQLLFDLNVILLTEGAPANREQSTALAAAHLEWLYAQLVSTSVSDEVRKVVLAANTIVASPERLVPAFATTVSAEAVVGPAGQPRRPASVTVVASASRETFLAAVANNQHAIAFHSITIADGVARVATTVYLPQWGAVNPVWVSLYRDVGGQWVRLPDAGDPVVPSILNQYGFPTEFNLTPAINRDYGANDPMKALRLDATMERIRGDVKAIERLVRNSGGLSFGVAPFDASYLPFLEKYRRADDPFVRYAAEFEWARLTDQPNLELWMDAFATQAASPLQMMAQQVIARYAQKELDTDGADLEGADRDELIAAAVNPDAVDSRLLPRAVPRTENIRQVRRSSRFALVEVVFASGQFGGSGYSMLFEHRNQRWVYLFVTRSWIS